MSVGIPGGESSTLDMHTQWGVLCLACRPPDCLGCFLQYQIPVILFPCFQTQRWRPCPVCLGCSQRFPSAHGCSLFSVLNFSPWLRKKAQFMVQSQMLGCLYKIKEPMQGGNTEKCVFRIPTNFPPGTSAVFLAVRTTCRMSSKGTAPLLHAL